MEKVIMFLKTMGDEYDGRILKKNQEHLYLFGPDGNEQDVRKLHCYPESEKTTRGVDADIVVIEEAAAMNPRFFSAVVVPLFSVKNTAVIGISTPQGEGNYYSKLLDKKGPDGRTIFRVVHILLVCDRCRAAGVPERCSCLQYMRPSWLPADRAEMVKRIMSEEADLYSAEAQGAVLQGRDKVFAGAYIEQLRNARAHDDLETTQPYIMIAVDPTAGGASRMAMVAAYFTATDPVKIIVRCPCPCPWQRQAPARAASTHAAAATAPPRPSARRASGTARPRPCTRRRPTPRPRPRSARR
jgi:hypothetical protein